MPKPQREMRLSLARSVPSTLVREQRMFQATANDATIVDSYNSLILAEAWNQEGDLDIFRRNPIGLWMHGIGCMQIPAPPIFRCDGLEVEPDKGLSFWPHFQREGIDKFADTIYGKYTEEPALLQAFSVGWWPIRWVDRSRDPSDYKDSEPLLERALAVLAMFTSCMRVYTRNLLEEISAVDLPGNRGALARGVLGEIKLNPQMEAVLETLGYIPKSRLSPVASENLEMSQDQLVESVDVFTEQLSDLCRTDLAETEVLVLVDSYKRLGSLLQIEVEKRSVAVSDDETEMDPEIEAAMLTAAETIDDLKGVNEMLVGVLQSRVATGMEV